MGSRASALCEDPHKEPAGAVEAYGESLAIARRMATANPGNVQAQTDLIASLYKVALAADGEPKSAALEEALRLLDQLETSGKLSVDKKGWKDMLLALRNGG